MDSEQVSEPEGATQAGQPFLDHPETEEAGRRILEAVEREGDRGAMLVAGEMLSAFLGQALQMIQPKVLDDKALNQLFKGAGPLSAWSARTKAAALIGLISPRSYAALDDLREVRNKAAHSEQAFALKTHHVRLRRSFDIGEGTGIAINRMALEGVMASFFASLKARGAEIETQHDFNPFATTDAIIAELEKRDDVMSGLEEKVWRVELALGVWLLLGVLRVERDAFLARVAAPRLDPTANEA